MEPTMKAQRKKWVQSLASLARELKVRAVRDDANRQAVTAMVDRLPIASYICSSASRFNGTIAFVCCPFWKIQSAF